MIKDSHALPRLTRLELELKEAEDQVARARWAVRHAMSRGEKVRERARRDRWLKKVKSLKHKVARERTRIGLKLETADGGAA